MAKIGTLSYDINGVDNLKKILQDDKKMALELQKVLKDTNAQMGKVDLSQLKQYNTLLTKQQKDAISLSDAKQKSISAEIMQQQKLQTEIARTELIQKRAANVGVQGHRDVNNTASLTNKTMFSQNNLLGQLSQAAGIYFSIYQVGSFIKSLYTVSGEFEKQKVSLAAILQNTDQAGVLFERIKSLAIKSPFQFSELVSYTKQLSAFSVPYNELYDTTKRLADVSAGLGVDMSRLVLAYGQVRSASVLRGQELRQFTEAGIPLIDELAKKFTKLTGEATSAGDVFDKISRREVSFGMVKDIFTELTSEGGKFYNFQAIQAETLSGKISNLKDSYQIMLSSIGEGNSGIMKDSVDMLTNLMNHWEDVAKILKTLIITYGTYKAILITVNAVQKINLALQGSEGVAALMRLINLSKVLTTSTYAQVVAQSALNAVMAINPIYLMAGAIAAVIGGLVLFADETQSAEYKVSELNKAVLDSRMQIENLKSSSDQYIKTAMDLNSSYSDRYKALQSLQSIMPSVFKNLNLEKLAAIGVAGAYKLVADQITKMEIGTARTNFYQSTKLLVDLQNKLKYENTGDTAVRKDLEDQIAKIQRTQASTKKEYVNLLVAQNKAENNNLKVQKEQSGWRDEVDRIKNKTKVFGIAWNEDEGYAEYIEKIQQDYDKLTKENKKYSESNKYSRAEIESNTKKLKAYKEILDTLGGVTKETKVKGAATDPIYERIKRQINAIDDAKTAYDKYLKTMLKPVALERVKKETGIDFSKTDATKKIESLSTAGMLPKNALSTTNRIAELTLKYDKTSTVNSFKDATDAIIRYVDDNKEKFNLYQKILGESGNETLAINLAFGTDKMAYRNYAQFVKNQISEALKAVGGTNPPSVNEILGLDQKSFEELPDNIKKLVETYKSAQSEIENNANETVFNLIKSHQNMNDAINAAQIKANADYESIELKRKDIGDKIANDTIQQRKKDLATEIANIKFNEFKKSSLWKSTFDDLKNISTETLSEVMDMLENKTTTIGGDASVEDFKEMMDKLRSLRDEMIERDPFKALSDQRIALANATNKLSDAERKLKAIKLGESVYKETIVDGKVVKSLLTEKEAIENVTNAKNEYNKENNQFVKAHKAASDKVTELSNALKGVGDAVGGTAGQTISLMGDIGNFAVTASEGITKVSLTGAQAMSSIEKASVILAIISAAIQLMQKLDELLPSAYKSYEKYAEKIKDINNLKDAVLEYQVAVLKASQAENAWFGKDSLRDMKDLYDLRLMVYSEYSAKLNEMQATYRNKSGGGWSTDFYNAILGGYDKIYGTNISGNNVKNTLSKAIDNLRIETRKASKGIAGSGIGGKSQKTEDLVSWVKNNPDLSKYGDLFDANNNNLINKELANVILEKYGDKLVGQTKDTLEALVKLREEYDEYLTKLQEYVDSLYSPLVDNMTSALWDWLDSGKSALDSFKDYASDTFRDIVTDMMKTIILKNVVGSFSTDISSLYDKYNAGKLTETQLMDEVTKRTQSLLGTYEDQLPTLQTMMQTLTSSLSGIGLDVKNTTSTSSGITASVQSLTEDTGNILASYINAMRADLSVIRSILDGTNSKGVYNQMYAIMQAYYPTITNTLALQQAELVKIQNNTLRSANNSDGILNAVDELRSTIKKATTSGSGTKLNV